MKQLHEQYIELIRNGPNGLFSKGDLARLELHVADGIVGAGVLAELGVSTLVDIGSGGGVPGIPLAIEMPETHAHLVESQQWKAEFLLTCVRALGLDSRLMVHSIRAEEAPTAIGRELLDAGTARALASPIVVAEYLAPLVRVGGHLVLWSTHDQAQDPSVAENDLLGLGAPELHAAASPLRDDGALIVWPRIAPCTDRVPRRPGVAARKPLR